MEYDIYDVDMKDGIVITNCHVGCPASKVDESLKELNKRHPGKNWVFGIDVHFRKFNIENVTWDYRYENTLRLNFINEVYNTGMEDGVNNIVHQVLGEGVELDWRDEQELEIHNVVEKGLEDELAFQLTEYINN